MYLAFAAGLVVALTLPLVIFARALARSATARAERGRDGLGPEQRARLVRYVAG